MRTAVRSCFEAFSSTYEGVVFFMYLDVKGLVTTAIGDLIDDNTGHPPSSALSLPWLRKSDGSPATRDEVSSEWLTVKNYPGAAHGGYRVLDSVTKLRLTEAGVNALVLAKFDEMAAYIVAHHFPDIDAYPADAQLAIMSQAWACGPAWPAEFPTCKTAILKQDFISAASYAHMNDTGNPGLVPRNAANHQLFVNAAQAIATGQLDNFVDPSLAHAAVAHATANPPFGVDGGIVHPAVDLTDDGT